MEWGVAKEKEKYELPYTNVPLLPTLTLVSASCCVEEQFCLVTRFGRKDRMGECQGLLSQVLHSFSVLISEPLIREDYQNKPWSPQPFKIPWAGHLVFDPKYII